MTNVPAIFEDAASGHETQRRRLVPSYDAFYATAIGALGLAGRPLQRVLDHKDHRFAVLAARRAG